MKIVFIVGTRPEFIKVAPVYKVFKEDTKWESILISTGQHSSMLSQLYDFFEIKPDINLELMQPDQSLSSLTARLFHSLDKEITKIIPDLILIQGDTTTTMVGSLVAFYHKIPIGHIEAGLRTNDINRPFPEETNRRITSIVANYNFCPTKSSFSRLRVEGKENCFIVGNTVIDALIWSLKKINISPNYYRKKFGVLLDQYKKIILVTAHRRESFGVGLKEIFWAISELAGSNSNYIFVFPVHLNPNVQALASEILGKTKNIKLLPPIPYDELIFLMNESHLVLTDSGGIQEEAPSLKKPVIVLRNETERIEALEANLSILAGTSRNSIIKTFNKIECSDQLYNQMKVNNNPYGDGKTSEKIKQIIDQDFIGK